MAAVAQAPRHWVYLDQERTHELHAQVGMRGGALVLATTEFPAGSRDPAEAVHDERAAAGEADLLLMLRELEEGLALTGTYYRARADEMRWARLAPPTRRPDLRAREIPVPGEPPQKALRVHHFHGEGAARDRLLISMPREQMPGRHVLAEMTFDFPLVELGDLRVLHARLTSATLARSIVREHLEAPRKGYQKLVEPVDYERAYGEGWLEKTRGMFSRAVARFVGFEAERPAPEPPAAQPSRLDLLAAGLRDPRVLALAGRYLDEPTRARLVQEGEHAIRRHIASLRRKEGHRVAYELSVVEASLLLGYAIPAQMWDLCEDEGPKLLRFLHGYA